MQRSNSGRKRTRSDPDGSVLLNTRVGRYRISGEKIFIDILKFDILRGEYNVKVKSSRVNYLTKNRLLRQFEKLAAA